MGIDSGIGLWYHVGGGECVRFDGPPHHFYLDYHRMGIDNAGILCYIGSTEVNRWVPSGQLEPVSMKQSVGFFFISPMLCAGFTISKSAASCLCQAWGGFPFHLFPIAGSPPGPQAAPAEPGPAGFARRNRPKDGLACGPLFCTRSPPASSHPASPRRRSRKFLYIRTYPPDCPFLPAASGTIILIEYYV